MYIIKDIYREIKYMGDALILQKTYIKKTFSDIKLTEANSTGYGNSSSQNLT